MSFGDSSSNSIGGTAEPVSTTRPGNSWLFSANAIKDRHAVSSI